MPDKKARDAAAAYWGMFVPPGRGFLSVESNNDGSMQLEKQTLDVDKD
jgi:hypothetical protein